MKEDLSTSWRGCKTRCRLEKLNNRFQNVVVAPLVGLLTTSFDDYKAVFLEFPDEKLSDAFEQELSDFAVILLDEDNTGKCSILHPCSAYIYSTLELP